MSHNSVLPACILFLIFFPIGCWLFLHMSPNQFATITSIRPFSHSDVPSVSKYPQQDVGSFLQKFVNSTMIQNSKNRWFIKFIGWTRWPASAQQDTWLKSTQFDIRLTLPNIRPRFNHGFLSLRLRSSSNLITPILNCEILSYCVKYIFNNPMFSCCNKMKPNKLMSKQTDSQFQRVTLPNLILVKCQGKS